MDISKNDLSILISKVKTAAEEVLAKANLTIYQVNKTNEYGVNTIQVLVNEANVDVDLLAECNNQLLDIVNDDLPDDYYLEVSTKGLEAPLKTDAEINNAIGSYIFVSLYEKNPLLNTKEIYGDLLKVDNESITLEVLNKTRKQEVIINRKSIALCRLAVKF